MKLEAALLEELDPDSFYTSVVKSQYRITSLQHFALLHWTAFYNSSECTKVVRSFESTLDYRVWMVRFCLLNLCARD